MDRSIPLGNIPPAPRLDREEPDLWIEDDIPTDDGGEAAASSGKAGDAGKPERE